MLLHGLHYGCFRPRPSQAGSWPFVFVQFHIRCFSEEGKSLCLWMKKEWDLVPARRPIRATSSFALSIFHANGQLSIETKLSCDPLLACKRAWAQDWFPWWTIEAKTRAIAFMRYIALYIKSNVESGNVGLCATGEKACVDFSSDVISGIECWLWIHLRLGGATHQAGEYAAALSFRFLTVKQPEWRVDTMKLHYSRHSRRCSVFGIASIFIDGHFASASLCVVLHYGLAHTQFPNVDDVHTTR